MLTLRPYQHKAIQSLFDYLAANPGKNPCLVVSTGGGKSIIQAAFIKQCLEWWPDTKVFVITHQKELVVQDARKLHELAPEINIGIFSAALGSKSTEEPVIYASIQSIYKKTVQASCIIVDEAHMISPKDSSMYQKFFENCHCPIIGMTATPYRLGMGMVTDPVKDGKALFDDLIEVSSIRELQEMGFLARLRSKKVFNGLDLSDLHLKGGEYVESEMNEKLNQFRTNEVIVDEIIHSARFYDRHHWLVFCVSIDHAIAITNVLIDKGILAGVVHGKMSKDDRDDVLWQFTHGNIEALVNVNLVTTGFDYPEIDLIAMLRPTMSPGLYLQMAGRGLRLKQNGGDCLVLDFAGNVMQHGPVTMVQPPRKKGEGKKGLAPCKTCPQCLEIVGASTHVCPQCGYVFPEGDRAWMLFDGDVNGDGKERIEIWRWVFIFTPSRTSGKPMFRLEYVSTTNKSISEFFCVFHAEKPFVRESAVKKVARLAAKCKVEFPQELWTSMDSEEWQAFMGKLQQCEPPRYVYIQPDPKNPRYKRITDKLWAEDVEEILEEMKAREAISGELQRRIYAC